MAATPSGAHQAGRVFAGRVPIIGRARRMRACRSSVSLAPGAPACDDRMEKSADITLDRPAQLPRFVADSANFENADIRLRVKGAMADSKISRRAESPPVVSTSRNRPRRTLILVANSGTGASRARCVTLTHG